MPPQPSSKKKGRARKESPGSAQEPDSNVLSPAACLECRNRKVRCNRELPKCSNCKRQGVPCQFPNPEDRKSQTKQLVEDVASFSGRLGHLEESLSHRMEILTNLVSQSIRDHGETRASVSVSPVKFPGDIMDTDINMDEGLFGQTSPKPRSSSIIVNDGPFERFYGASSTYSHLMRSKKLIERLLVAYNNNSSANNSPTKPASRRSSPEVKPSASFDNLALAQVQRKFESFSAPSHFKESFEIGDDRPVELPPRSSLEDAIELYLSEFSLDPPLFQRDILMNAVHIQYSANLADVDESWALCFSNIILRSSGWRSRQFRVNSFATSGIDDSVMSLLIANANRALRQLEKFCKLQVVNIQALFLLALVARDFIHFNVYERIFDRVCQLVKQMGLHEQGIVGANPTLRDLEKQNILWLLYSVDKQRAFIRGPPCRIYLFECDIQLPAATDSKSQLVRSNLQLTCLVEEIYRSLYCPQASRQDIDTRQQHLERLDRHLEQLIDQVRPLLDTAQDRSDAEKIMGLQLAYAFNVTKLLIHSRSMDGEDKNLRVSTACRALKIIQSLTTGTFIFNGGVVVLERFFCNYSVIAFHEVFESLVTESSPSATQKLALLTATTNALRLLSHTDRPYAYCTRLYKNFAWCTEIATLIYNARKLSHFPISNGSTNTPFVNNSESLAQSNYPTCEISRQSSGINISLSNGLKGDFSMDDGSSNTLSSGPSSLDDLHAFSQSNFDFGIPLDRGMEFSMDDFAFHDSQLQNMGTLSTGIQPESTLEFQQELQSMFDKSSGLELGFQPVVAGQDLSSFTF